MSKYIPLEDRLVIRPAEKPKSIDEEKTEGGIIIGMAKKETAEGTVFAVGPGYVARDTGTFVKTTLKVGDKVLYGVNQGMQIDLEVEGEEKKIEMRLMRESDVLLRL
jgi:co-chaperonin GroES (HSP10)